jgi:hypothetical protein
VGTEPGRPQKKVKVNFTIRGDKVVTEKQNMTMTAKAREARRLYMAEWRRNNKDKIARAQNRYWERRASEGVSGRP